MPDAGCSGDIWPWIRHDSPLSHEDPQEGPPVKTRRKPVLEAYPEAFFQFRLPPEYFIKDEHHNIMTLDPEEVDSEQATKYGYGRLRGQGGVYTIIPSQVDNLDHILLRQLPSLPLLPENVFFRWNLPKHRVAPDMVMIRNGNLVTSPLGSGVHELRIDGGLIDLYNKAGRYRLLEAPVIREVVRKPDDEYSMIFDRELLDVPPSHLQRARHQHSLRTHEAPFTRLGREQDEPTAFIEICGERSGLFEISQDSEDDLGEDGEYNRLRRSVDIYAFDSNDHHHGYHQHQSHRRHYTRTEDGKNTVAGTHGRESHNDEPGGSRKAEGGGINHFDEAQNEYAGPSVESVTTQEAVKMFMAHRALIFGDDDPFISGLSQDTLTTVSRHKDWLNQEEAEEKKQDARLARRARNSLSRQTIIETREAHRRAQEAVRAQEKARMESLQSGAEGVGVWGNTRTRAASASEQSFPPAPGFEYREVSVLHASGQQPPGEQQHPQEHTMKIPNETEHIGDKVNETVPKTQMTTQGGLLNNKQDSSAAPPQVDTKLKHPEHKQSRNASAPQKRRRRNFEAEAEEEFVPVRPRSRRPRAPRPSRSRTARAQAAPLSGLAQSAQSSAAVPVGMSGTSGAAPAHRSPSHQPNDRYPAPSLQSPLSKLVLTPPLPRTDVSHPDVSDRHKMTGVGASAALADDPTGAFHILVAPSDKATGPQQGFTSSNQGMVTLQSGTPAIPPRAQAAAASGNHTTSTFAPLADDAPNMFTFDSLVTPTHTPINPKPIKIKFKEHKETNSAIADEEDRKRRSRAEALLQALNQGRETE
ncbi:hypothetical protein GGR57DRAFT_499986 [Xylariaceae sp. FL1272]|nr:hypothetical protein GGR57DRAFT_499986 [Xylariaceae sp. FL1272]